MKNKLNFRFIVYLAVGFILLTIGSQNTYSQSSKKNTVRLKADYFKIMNGEIYFDIKASSRIDRQTEDVSNINISISNEIGDDEIDLGSVTTDMEGTCRFTLKSLNSIQPDSTNTYTVHFAFKGNDTFKRASKSIHFKDANIEAELVKKDSIHYIKATLKDASTNTPLSERLLNVQVQRLFRPLKIGPEFNSTDENGTIIVPIEEDIPGVNGNLTFEVVLKDSDDFGTVKALVNAPIGIPIVDESTFDERTMWSPRNKTPYLLLIFPNLVILGMWGLIIYLIINLYKISKSKLKNHENN
jgi:archaellin